jgi:PD-(D/E)XK endonuclease
MEDLLVNSQGSRLATNFLGEYAIAKVVLRCVEKRFGCSRPLIECRYDLVLDDGLKLYRTQVKYANAAPPKQSQGVVQVGLAKWRNGGRAVIPCYTADEIDLLIVYVRKIDRLLWFGPEVFDGRRALFIRIEPSRNNQTRGCLMAEDYIW